MRRSKAKPMTPQKIAEGLITKAAGGTLEVCPLCGTKVVSVALHYLSCPKIDERNPDQKGEQHGQNN